MLDVAGISLTDAERVTLAHPLVGAVILFSRNFESTTQLAKLTADIRSIRTPSLLIAVDHEGGRVQRFRDGFTRLPPMRTLGAIWAKDPALGESLTRATGYILAAELLVLGVDLSFTPVLDVDFGESGVIGDRAFSRDPEAIATLAQALMDGLANAGMGNVGKHFPGHGFVRADSHVAIPVDERSFADIESIDLVPYARLHSLKGVMPAHVIYSAVDDQPAGFSRKWLQDVLRGELAFKGLIVSDDLSMEGASVAGGIVQRGEAALRAGCDMVLVCNNTTSAQELLQGLGTVAMDQGRAELLRGRHCLQLAENPEYQKAKLAFGRYFDAEGALIGS
jgi:beta-N-acetylhexosaminidase